MITFKKEILFKAILKNNGAFITIDGKPVNLEDVVVGDWIYGSPIKATSRAYYSHMCATQRNIRIRVPIKSDTLCQYVNVVVNDEKLFENDVVFDGRDACYVVRWECYKWKLVKVEGFQEYDLNELVYMPNAKIIGNTRNGKLEEITKDYIPKKRNIVKPVFFKKACPFCCLLEHKVRESAKHDRYGWQTFNVYGTKVGCELDSFNGSVKYYFLNEDGEDTEQMEYCPDCSKKFSLFIPTEEDILTRATKPFGLTENKCWDGYWWKNSMKDTPFDEAFDRLYNAIFEKPKDKKDD